MSGDMVEVVIDSIRVSLMSQQRIIILREVGADRYLPIWIGVYEAEAIAIALQEVEIARPLTHDLLKNVFKAINAQVLRVEVISLRDDTYYGNIVAQVNGNVIDIDSRPSDALALAVRSNVPILVARDVMDSAGIIPEEDIQEGDIEGAAGETPQSELDEEGEQRLSIFEDFLDKLEQKSDEDDDEEQES
ncbi:MAG: bifunctional nuclease family protein [Anaerolineales bacterium]|jgi:bifunctional DNase/RNase